MYSNILSDAVTSSNWTYTQITEKCKEQGVKISRSYLSKLCTGHMPPASDEINKALAAVLSKEPTKLYTDISVAKYKAILPRDIFEAIASGH